MKIREKIKEIFFEKFLRYSEKPVENLLKFPKKINFPEDDSKNYRNVDLNVISRHERTS